MPQLTNLTMSSCYHIQKTIAHYSADSLKEADQDDERYLADNVSTDILNTLTHTGVPPHRLDLKRGTIAAIQRNLSVEHGLVKNARVQIVALRQQTINIRVVGHQAVHCIPRINFTFHPHYSAWTINRRQFSTTYSVRKYVQLSSRIDTGPCRH